MKNNPAKRRLPTLKKTWRKSDFDENDKKKLEKLCPKWARKRSKVGSICPRIGIAFFPAKPHRTSSMTISKCGVILVSRVKHSFAWKKNKTPAHGQKYSLSSHTCTYKVRVGCQFNPTLSLQQQRKLVLPGAWACRPDLLPKYQVRWA